MRKYLIAAAALALLSAPVLADPPGDRGDRGHGEGRGHAEQNQAAPGDHDRGNRGPQMSVQAPPNRGEQDRGFGRGDRGRMENQAPQMAAPQNRGEENRNVDRAERNRDFNRGERGQTALQAPPDRGGQDRGDNRRMGFERRGFDNRNAFNDNRGGDFNRGGRNNYRSPGFGGPRHDFRDFRDFHRDFRSARHFRLPSYRRPAGWYSHRWAFGEFLPAAFWVRDYWLIDFADYDLPPPPYGAIWVRVDRDALLVDEDSGEIITVVYDVFY